jgi:hypothetical protein
MCGNQPGKVQVKVWVNPFTTIGSLYAADPGTLRLKQWQMITVAFAPAGAKIPAPRAQAALEQQDIASGTSTTTTLPVSLPPTSLPVSLPTTSAPGPTTTPATTPTTAPASTTST